VVVLSNNDGGIVAANRQAKALLRKAVTDMFQANLPYSRAGVGMIARRLSDDRFVIFRSCKCQRSRARVSIQILIQMIALEH
jgi:nucleotidyltransferase/DNA polymerase involved in DNA repair